MKRALLAAASIVPLIAGSAAPAHANDGRVEVYYNGLRTVGTWDDLTDNLCVNNLSTGYSKAFMIRPDGSILREIIDPAGGGQTCTGNMSIGEDQPFRLRVCWNWYGNPTVCNEQTGRYT